MPFDPPLLSRRHRPTRRRAARRKRTVVPVPFTTAAAPAFPTSPIGRRKRRRSTPRRRIVRKLRGLLGFTLAGSGGVFSPSFARRPRRRRKFRTKAAKRSTSNALYLVAAGTPTGPGGNPVANKDLISLARAKFNLQSVTDNSQDSLLGYLITAASDAIQKYCRRDFFTRAYDELYNGAGDRRLMLREYPILSVESVRYRPITVLKIQNANLALNQRATVAVTSAGLTLVRVASGVKYTDLVNFVPNPTLNALAVAVNALGNGWQAQATGDAGADYGLFPSADLYVPPSIGTGLGSQGALTARGNFADLKLHTYELQGYQWDPRGWLLRAIPYTDPELLMPEDLVWPVGVNNFRVQYTAGFGTIPEAVQEACAEWVAMLYFRTLRDPQLASQAIPGATAQTWIHSDGKHPPAPIAALLAPYVRRTVATNQS